MLKIFIAIFISYLIGAIPCAYIFCRLIKGVDIRKSGSGNVGATNASRVLGKPLGIVVLLLDIFKGFLAVWLLAGLSIFKATGISSETLGVTLGLSCVAGHNWPIFLGFKGGKGIATTLGVLLALALQVSELKIILVFSLLTWIAAFIITRVVSVASILAGISLPIYAVLFGSPKAIVLFCVVLSLLAVLRHLPNIKRIFQGEEPRIK